MFLGHLLRVTLWNCLVSPENPARDEHVSTIKLTKANASDNSVNGRPFKLFQISN